MSDDLVRRNSVVKMIQRHCERVGTVIKDKHFREVYETAHNQLIETLELIPSEGRVDNETGTSGGL